MGIAAGTERLVVELQGQGDTLRQAAEPQGAGDQLVVRRFLPVQIALQHGGKVRFDGPIVAVEADALGERDRPLEVLTRRVGCTLQQLPAQTQPKQRAAPLVAGG